MRIVFLNFAVDWGGGERWTLRAAEGLARRGHDILLMARKGAPLAPAARSAGLATEELQPGPDYSLRTILRLRARLKRFHTDVLVAHQNRDVRTGGVAAWSLRIPVLHRNGFPILKHARRHRLSHRFTTRILTNSARIRDQYTKFGWIDPDTIDVVPNGVAPIQPAMEPSAIRNTWGVTNEDQVALYAGRVTRVKRVSDLLEAFAELDPSSRWKLVIMGQGSALEALQRYSEHLHLQERVRFAGFVENAAAYFTGADVVCLPSSEEGMPNTLMEAMVQGVPVAATPVGDVPYLLNEGKAGWIVPVSDPAAWTHLFQRWEERPSGLRETGQKGKEQIEEQFTVERMLDGIEHSLQRTIAMQNGGKG
jgi:glycosyltransferase involved in cell wall biosynthesis